MLNVKRLWRRKLKRFYILRTPKYVNRHKGREFLVLATGPTLKTHRNEIKNFIWKNDPVVIATNFIDNLCVPDYHMFNSRMAFCEFVSEAQGYLLLPPQLPKWIIRAKTNRNYEIVPYKNNYNWHKGEIKIKKGIIYSKISSVATIAGATAIIMGAKKLYFAGLDGFSRYSFDSMHHYKIKEKLSYGRRIIHEGATHDILNDLSKHCPVEIITPTVYKK